MLARYVLCALLLVLPSSIQAQEASDPSILTLERIFTANEFQGAHFGGVHWMDRGAAYSVWEPSTTVEGGQDLVRVDTKTGLKEVLIEAKLFIPSGAEKPLAVEEYSWSSDHSLLLLYTSSQKVWRENTRGDYWVFERRTNKLSRLGGNAPASTLQFAKFSPDGKSVGYVRENNLYVESLADQRITPLTKDGSKTTINGTFDWVYEEELFLRDGWRWSPDGQHIAYWQLNTSGVHDMTLIDNTAALYPKLHTFPYPKTGQRNSAARIGFVPVKGGETTWLKIAGDPRNHYLARMDWANSPEEILVEQLNRLQNENRVLLANTQTGNVRTIFVERDGTWVDVYENHLHWLDKGKSFTWISERDGWRQIYRMDRDGGASRRITTGDFDVVDLLLVDEKREWVYYIASPENPNERFLFRSRLDGSGQKERLTPEGASGTHGYEISPDGRWAIHHHSAFWLAPQTELVSLPDHKTVRVLADRAPLQKKIDALKRGQSEFFRIPMASGIPLDAWLMKPPDFDAKKRYPILFHIYGEPWSQTVEDHWGGEFHLWHLLLTQQGYLVASVDNRGTSAPRGRAWRKSIYRKLGVVPSADQAAALQAIEKRPYVDSQRVGIWGWSGGGSMSLNMIFRYPDLYHTAMAVAPVADMHYYDSIYQERYMGLPQDNPEDYKKGSPITYANQLKGNLLIAHGTGDDNVHYQTTELLANALIAANKPFTLMPYPNRTHAIAEGPGTRRHLFELLTRFLKSNLPPGPKGR